MSYKWLLFDADGTLFDFHAASMDALAQTFAYAGIAHTDEHVQLYRRINTACWEEFERGEISAEILRSERFRRMNHELGASHDPLDLSKQYIMHLSQGNQLLPGATDLLFVLQKRFNMLLITNGLKEVQRPRFAATNMSRWFSEIVISDEVGFAKPDPTIFDICFERMGHPDKSEVLIIGDSLTSDMVGGLNYGIDTCWYNPTGKTRPIDMPITYTIRTLYDLVPLL
ncbi:MAG: YjjG family noncanonical pyrimidine nucleotidase [Candidatus Promineifilaceae bacterium]